MIVGFAELRLMTADEEIEARLQIGRWCDLLPAFPVIVGFRQSDIPFIIGLLRQQCFTIVLINAFLSTSTNLAR